MGGAWSGPPAVSRPPKMLGYLLEAARKTCPENEAPGRCECASACDCQTLPPASVIGPTATGAVLYPVEAMNRLSAEVADLQARVQYPQRFPTHEIFMAEVFRESPNDKHSSRTSTGRPGIVEVQRTFWKGTIHVDVANPSGSAIRRNVKDKGPPTSPGTWVVWEIWGLWWRLPRCADFLPTIYRIAEIVPTVSTPGGQTLSRDGGLRGIRGSGERKAICGLTGS